MKKVRKEKTSKEKKATKKVPDYEIQEFDHPAQVSMYFGFTPIKTPRISKEDFSVSKSFHDDTENKDPLCENCLEKSAVLRNYTDGGLSSLPHPLLIEYSKPILGSNSHKKKNLSEVGLEILGLSGSIAEAMAIRTAASILEDEGYENLELRLNCIGDKDSIADFEKALHNYVRKNINDMPADLRKAVKKDVFTLCNSQEKAWEKWSSEAPKAMNFLSESSRQYFKEVLEFVEALGFPYSISYGLIGNPRFCSHTLFEIVSETNSGPIVLARGFRYGRISKKVGLKRELPSLGVSLAYKPKNENTKKSSKGLPKPKFYLMQIGYAAKLKALNVIESLRKAKISVIHSVAKDKLTSQMSYAENQNITHIILIGQKEALEDSVMVRNVSTRSQETVPIPELSAYLKKLSK